MGRRRRDTGPGASLHGILLVDKPLGPTSHDVVGWARRVLRCRRIGHCGTLDPAASGLLVLAVGVATRTVPLLSAADKTDEAYEKGVSCARCLDEYSDADRERFRERQRQIELAKARGETHIGG